MPTTIYFNKEPKKDKCMKNKKDKFKTAIFASLAISALASCSSSYKIKKSDSLMQPTTIINGSEADRNFLIMSDNERKIIGQSNTFAINLFRTQVGMDSKVVSPVSVAYLMGMLANGANGNTQEEIMKCLGMEGVSILTLNEAYKSFINMAAKWDKQTTINIANCIAVNKTISLKETYKTDMTSMYDADVESLDFASPSALETINTWCSKKTEGMIPKIVDQLDNNALAVLMNAIYFNGTWKSQFDKNDTEEERFQGYTRDVKRVKMMHQNEKFYYTSNDDYAAVSLPYGNGTYTMTVILPNNGKSTTDVMNGLNADKFDKMSHNMEECIVDLKLPRFKTSTKSQLNKPISELGAPSIFISGKADFSNMSATPMFVSAMIQKAKIEVSEEGTKAAAVTAGVMVMSALSTEEPRHVAFHANRPFIYTITERNSGAILFIGQYTGPEE